MSPPTSSSSSLPVAAGVLWSAMWRITRRRGAASRVGGKFCLHKVDTLDHRRQRVLLGAQFADGCFERGHLLLHVVDDVQFALHGAQPLIHGVQLFEDGPEQVIALATRTLASVETHGGSEPVPRDTKMSPPRGATVERQDNHELMNVLSRLLAENLNQDNTTASRRKGRRSNRYEAKPMQTIDA
jgi:hypothetical protein